MLTIKIVCTVKLGVFPSDILLAFFGAGRVGAGSVNGDYFLLSKVKKMSPVP